MSLLDKFAKTAKSKLASGSKAALKGAGDAFNRLDELGGEARDSIKEWYEQSPAMGTMREYIEKRSAKGEVADEASEPEEKVVEAEIVPETLGDAAIAVQVFGSRSCPWSGRAVRLLEDQDVEHRFIELDDPENANANYASRLVAETKQNTEPYIYVRGQFLGGFNALDELVRLGQLEVRVSTETDKTARITVEVAPRPSTDEVPPATNADHPADADPPN